MKYFYDREHDSLTIKLAHRKYADSEEMWPGIVVDFDDAGRPIGIEFSSDASKLVDVEGLAAGRTVDVRHPALPSTSKTMNGPGLRAVRETLGMTQAQLAEAIGVPANTIARWEREELEIEKPKVLELALRAVGSVPVVDRPRTQGKLLKSGETAQRELSSRSFGVSIVNNAKRGKSARRPVFARAQPKTTTTETRRPAKKK